MLNFGGFLFSFTYMAAATSPAIRCKVLELLSHLGKSLDRSTISNQIITAIGQVLKYF